MSVFAAVVLGIVGLAILPRLTITVAAFCVNPLLGVIVGIVALFSLGA